MRSLAISCSAPSNVASETNSLAASLAWLAELMQQHGPGEYIVRLSADGRITVKRPQAPLRFEWDPGDASTG